LPRPAASPSPKQPTGRASAKNAKGEWTGSIAILAGGILDAPLSAISVKDATVKFSLIGMPHEPSFEGKLSADGNALDGDAMSDQGLVPFHMKRNGEADVKLPPPSTPVAKEWEGSWEGVVKVPNGPQFRVVMKLSGASGKLISVDEGGQEFLLISITHKDKQLQFRTLRGKFSGTVNDGASEIAGDYAVGGLNVPLVFKRPAAEGAK
jgi:hypothetical protein